MEKISFAVIFGLFIAVMSFPGPRPALGLRSVSLPSVNAVPESFSAATVCSLHCGFIAAAILPPIIPSAARLSNPAAK